MNRLNLLFIDNFDSFTFNLVDEFRRRGCAVNVWRNDISADEGLELALSMPKPSMIVLSPGPGSPSEAGCCIELIKKSAGKVPVFGICLGHQAIVEAMGGKVGFAGEVVHGKPALVEHDGTGIFAGLDSPLQAGRYHSLAALTLPSCLKVIAKKGALTMGIEHLQYPIIGLQFHPESILTPMGGVLIESVIKWAIDGGEIHGS